MLIHIGYYKTGTTWLQKHLFTRDSGCFQPVAPDSLQDVKDSAKFGSFFFLVNRDGVLLSPFADRTDEIREFVGRLVVAPDRCLVISNERLSGYPMTGGFDAKLIAVRIHEAFPEARVLIVVRNPVEMLLSAYLQYLRRGGTMSLAGLFQQRHDNRTPGFSVEFFRYSRLVGCYQQLFSADQVLVLPYELFAVDPVSYFNEIGRFAGVAVPRLANTTRRENATAGIAAELLGRPLNPFGRRSSLNAYSPVSSRLSRKTVALLKQGVNRVIPASWNQRLRRKQLDFIGKKLGGEFLEQECRELSRLTGREFRAYGYGPEVVDCRAGIVGTAA